MLFDRFPQQPQPGEIWEISSERDATYYVHIIREAQAEQPDCCSVMLLSIESEYLSNVDLLIPPTISGLDRDILAETWNVGSIEIDRLRLPVGKRLSRQIYDLLLSIGDVDCGSVTEMPTVREIRKLGLLILPERSRINDPQLAEFHRRERALLSSLNPQSLNRITQIVDRVLEIEREFSNIERTRTSLSAWFQQQIDTIWQDARNFVDVGDSLPLGTASRNENRYAAIPVRSANDDLEIMQTIDLITTCDNEEIRRKLLSKLGAIGSGNEAAIQTLVDAIAMTIDDETLWAAVDSLRRISPGHPSTGIEKLKSIALGSERVIFIVNIVPKLEERLGILLQVYPDSTAASLPENLKLILEDEDGNSLREVISSMGDECLQLKLSGKPREIFSVCLELNGRESIEDFVI